jgi:hypothetical protein
VSIGVVVVCLRSFTVPFLPLAPIDIALAAVDGNRRDMLSSVATGKGRVKRMLPRAFRYVMDEFP